MDERGFMLLRCYAAETELDHVDERGFKMALQGALDALTLLPAARTGFGRSAI